jgi:GT2 family glycosyltransferase
LKQSVQLAVWYAAARIAGWLRVPARGCAPAPAARTSAPDGISVVIPSRNGQSLLAAQLPGIAQELASLPAETIVVDNGSTDGTAAWLAAEWPGIEVEVCAAPLSFAAAVNRGMARARYSRVCLLNNDMLLEPGFFMALDNAFRAVPSLFCATAQIRFPAGVRREETGKAVMAQTHPDDFPIRCDEPIPGEDLTYVLYGSGGCSLYDAAMLRSLGGADEAYAPAYVEDLDLGYRAWQRGWPTVFVAGAMVEHRHRATTSRYYSEAQLAEILERNYLKFLARAISHRPLFRRLWKQALDRLRRRSDRALRFAPALALSAGPAAQPRSTEEEFLALTAGDVAVFPGRDASQEPLVMFADRIEQPADSVLANHCEVVLVRKGKELALRAARRWTGRKWAQRKQETVGQAGTAYGHSACPEN